MSFKEQKLSELASKSQYLSSIKNLTNIEQIEKLNSKIKELNREITKIKQDKSSYIYLSDIYGTKDKRKILTVEAKRIINNFNQEIKKLTLYLHHLNKDNNLKLATQKRLKEEIFVDDKVILSNKQQLILDNLITNKLLDNSEIIDVITVWKYIIMEKSLIENHEIIYIIIKYVNDYNVNNTSNLEFETKLNAVKGTINREIKKYPKKSYERRILKYNKKFIKSIIKLNMKEKDKEYDYRYDILEYFINDKDGFIYLNRLFNYDNSLFNLRDKNNNHIFNNILIKYVESYKKELENHEKYYIRKEYFEQLIKLFAEANTFQLDDKDKQISNIIIKDFEQYLKTSNFKRDSVLCALDSLRNLFTLNDRIDNTKDISVEEITSKFGIINQLNNLVKYRDFELHNSNRVKFDDEYTFMLDGKNVDYCCAYTITLSRNGHLILSIHTPDIECLIDENSSLDKLLYNKMFSMNNWRQFFPNEILEKLVLIPLEYRPCMTYQIELLGNGKIGNYRFIKSNVKVTEKVTEQELDNGLKNPKFKPFIQASYMIDCENNYKSLSNRIEATYNKLVNNVVGACFEKNKLPFIYVNHIEQDSQKFIEMISNLNYIFSKIPDKDFKDIYKIICDDVNKAYYDILNHGHSELGFNYKSDVLNPLNSYVGIVCQRLITQFLISKNYQEKDKLNAISELISVKNYANLVKEEKSKLKVLKK